VYIELKMQGIKLKKETPLCIYINAYRGTYGHSLNYFTKKNIKYKIYRSYVPCPGHAVEYRYHSVPYLHALGFMHFSVHYMVQCL
jgi:hypothetical protein